MKFTELNLDEKLMKGIEDAGFETLMPVQEESLAHTLQGKDVSVQSQTGTGKTAAFLITIFQHFLNKESPWLQRALILAPTRELADQIEKDAQILGRHLPFKIGSFYGGVGYNQQERLLRDKVELIIGTPGRLLDYNSKGKLDFRTVGYLVIDEADRMFDMGFYPDIARILRGAQPRKNRLNMLFSATLDVKTRGIAREFMNRPVTVEIEPERITVDKIEQRLYHVAKKEKLNLMLGVMKKELPKNALIFTNMKHAAASVAKHLEYNGYKCLHISGDLPQSKRLRVIEDFKSGKLPFLVATDVAARGLHIEDLEMIFNYDLPGDPENYVHRIGRTARAGKSGKAISLACEDYIYNLEPIEQLLGIKIPVRFAEDDLYEESKSEGMNFDPGRRSSGRGGGRGGGADRRGGKRTTRSKAEAPRKGKPDRHHKKKETEESKERPERKKRRPSKPKDDRRQDQGPPKDREQGPPKKKKGRKPGTPKSAEERQDQQKKQYPKGKGKGKPRSDRDRDRDKDRKKGTDKSRSGGRKLSLDDRIEYYKKKYGDDFKVTPDGVVRDSHPPPPPPKKSLVKKIKGIFKKPRGAGGRPR